MSALLSECAGGGLHQLGRGCGAPGPCLYDAAIEFGYDTVGDFYNEVSAFDSFAIFHGGEVTDPDALLAFCEANNLIEDF